MKPVQSMIMMDQRYVVRPGRTTDEVGSTGFEANN